MCGVLILRQKAACHEGSVRSLRMPSEDRGRDGLECQVQTVEHYLAGNKEPPPHQELQTAGGGVGRLMVTTQQLQPRMTSGGIQHHNQGNGQVTQLTGHPSGHPTRACPLPRIGTAS